MPLYSFEGKSPVVHETAFIAPSADLIGDVTVEACNAQSVDLRTPSWFFGPHWSGPKNS